VSATVDATFYVQIEATRTRWRTNAAGEPAVDSAKAVRITQSRPRTQAPDTVMVKLTVRLPVAAFDPLRPEAVVVVPESLTEAAPVEVVAIDPHDGGEA
jgi:hypothetical protein